MSKRIESELLESLARGWRLLRLSVEASNRVAGWDWIAITASNDPQARIYERQLEEARRRGLIPEGTRTCVVPDPGGNRIGSGGATLNALRHLAASEPGRLDEHRILLIHAGGDSKRLPWASVPGKLFIPFPLQADQDHAVPTLFDHLLALTAPIPAQAAGTGMLLSLTGDVLPLFDAGAVPLDGSFVVTTPVSLDVAERHGVIVPGADSEVARLLQKPTLDEMVSAGALSDGAARIDTGIFYFDRPGLAALANAACAVPDPVETLVDAGQECTLYEEIAWAMVPSQADRLDPYVIGPPLKNALGGVRLHHCNLDRFAFVHLGASAEYISHLSRHWFGHLPPRVLAEEGRRGGAANFCYVAELPEDSQTGARTAILNSSLSAGMRVGNRCIIADFEAHEDPLTVPDNCCCWQVPVIGDGDECRIATLCCGVDDNPKDPFDTGTFCNRGFCEWMAAHGVDEHDLWPEETAPRTLWTARLFPAVPEDAGLASLRWLLAPNAPAGPPGQWLRSPRLSLADLQQRLDIERLFSRRDHLRTRLVLRALRVAVGGMADRNIEALAFQLPTDEVRARAISLVPASPVLAEEACCVVPSRQWQVRANLLRAAGQTDRAQALSDRAYAAVQTEVANAMAPGSDQAPVCELPAGAAESVELPVRFDLAGGWSDTPPYCLERPAGVLNLAMTLNGERPVRVSVEAIDRPEWHLQLGESGQQTVVTDPAAPTEGRTGLDDPFVLLRTALKLTGYGTEDRISQGVRLVSSAKVPRGSGLGTSSILGAGVVAGLQRLAGRPSDPETVSDLVLNMEQRMTTGGGWQDQIGGLQPGVKFVSSVPVRPLSLKIEPVPLLPAVLEEFRRRFVLAFSGQERLAKNVLQIVVGRYLSRDQRVLEAIEGLVELAREGRQMLSMGRIDDLGGLLREVWALHQQLDPHCSNPGVDSLFRAVDDLSSGYKLAGAGGGGFMGILAKDAEAAGRIRRRLAEFGTTVRVYDWDLDEG